MKSSLELELLQCRENTGQPDDIDIAEEEFEWEVPDDDALPKEDFLEETKPSRRRKASGRNRIVENVSGNF